MNLFEKQGISTLEPLIEAVRHGVESTGWELSGLQKTTSHQFEGKWEGESTRSAYLFFHLSNGPEYGSIDVYLDETSQGLTGNLALVVDLASFADLGDPEDALRTFTALSSRVLPDQYTRPLSLRFRLRASSDDPSAAETEVRFKLRLPRRTIGEGAAVVRQVVAKTVKAFEVILSSDELATYVPTH